MERPVDFKSKGNRLTGILHLPHGAFDRGVILVNAGFKYRVGPYRIFVRMARRLCEEGIASLRFDPPGVGNSEGELLDRHYDMFDTVHTIDAVDFMMREGGAKRVTVLGLCTGSRSAVVTAATDDRIDSLIAVSLPIKYFLPNSPTARYRARTKSKSAGLSPQFGQHYMLRYLDKLASPKAWWRLLTLKSDFNFMRRVIVNFMLTRGRKEHDQDGGEILKSCLSFLESGGKALFVYGDHDAPLIEDFEENVARPVDHALSKKRKWYDLCTVKGGDHTFSSRQSQNTLTELIVDWLKPKEGFQTQQRLA